MVDVLRAASDIDVAAKCCSRLPKAIAPATMAIIILRCQEEYRGERREERGESREQ